MPWIQGELKKLDSHIQTLLTHSAAATPFVAEVCMPQLPQVFAQLTFVAPVLAILPWLGPDAGVPAEVEPLSPTGLAEGPCSRGKVTDVNLVELLFVGECFGDSQAVAMTLPPSACFSFLKADCFLCCERGPLGIL